MSKNPAEIASNVLDGIADFVRNDKPRHMQLVRITVFQAHMLQPFFDEMNKRADNAKNKGFFKRLAGTFHLKLCVETKAT